MSPQSLEVYTSIDPVHSEDLVFLMSFIQSDFYTLSTFSSMCLPKLCGGGDADIKFRVKCYKVSHSLYNGC